jgi:ferrous iron transport protein B
MILPGPVERELDELVGLLQKNGSHHSRPSVLHEAIQLLSSDNGFATDIPQEVFSHVLKDRERLDFLDVDRQSVFVEGRYRWIKNVCQTIVRQQTQSRKSFSDKLDRILVHKVWGYLAFFALMGIMFQSIFLWATAPMEWIGLAFDGIGNLIVNAMPPGDLRDLGVNGALSGVAAVVTFLPQILLLFFFLGLLEDTGYMSRAAFIMDRLMGKVGLHGKSFIPLLSSFACAIPGIMATRTIESPKDRLVTMLVAPLMSCSARLPVYTLLIAAFVPQLHLFGVLSLPGLTLFSLYFFGLVTALIMAWVFKKTLLRGPAPVLIMELPPYRIPSLRSVLIQMWERSKLFLREAGTFILSVSIVLWFLASYPRLEGATPTEQLKQSFAGRAGHLIEPLIRPLGFDWKIGVGLIGSVLQREVFVSTMGTIYNIQNSAADEGTLSLKEKLQQDRDPVTGRPTFTLLTAICLMVYYMLAMQCLSTVAVMRRETHGWKWPVIQIAYMTALAYGATFLVYRFGLSLGIGGT